MQGDQVHQPSYRHREWGQRADCVLRSRNAPHQRKTCMRKRRHKEQTYPMRSAQRACSYCRLGIGCLSTTYPASKYTTTESPSPSPFCERRIRRVPEPESLTAGSAGPTCKPQHTQHPRASCAMSATRTQASRACRETNAQNKVQRSRQGQNGGAGETWFSQYPETASPTRKEDACSRLTTREWSTIAPRETARRIKRRCDG